MKKKKLSEKASKATDDDDFHCAHIVYNDQHELFVCLVDGEIWSPDDDFNMPCSKDCNGYTPDS